MAESKKRKFFEVDENEDDAVKANYDKDPGSFLRFYRSLPAKTYDTVRIFERPEFYTVYDEDAELIAKEFFNTTKVIKAWGKPGASATPRKAIKTNSMATPAINATTSASDGPQYLNLNKGNQFETILKVLIHEKRCKVEIYACGDDRKWGLKKKGSPGNMAELEDVLFAGNNEMQETNTLIAVKLAYDGGQRVIGAAFIDVILKKIGVAQLLDNDQLTNLESLIMQVGAKECYTMPLDEKDLDCQKMKTVYEKCDLVVTEMKRNDFASQDIEQDLRRLLGEKRFNTIKMSLIDDKHAMSSVSCLLNGLALMGDETNFGAYKMYRFDLNQYMRLDTAAIYALNVLPNPKEPNQGQNLYGLLNRCKTPMGSRKLLQWLKQPLLDLEAINNRHDIVQIFYEDENLCKDLRTKCLRRIPDLERLSKKVQRNRASLQDCVVIYQFIQRLPEISETLKNGLGEQKLITEKFIEPLERLKENLSGFENLIEETIDLDMVDEGEYVINSSFDDELKEISDKKKKVVKKIKGREDEVKIQIGSPSSFKIDNDKTHGWFYRISRKDEKCIGGKKNEKLFTILQPISKVLKFQDAEMKALSEKYTELSASYNKKSADLVREIMKIVSSYLPVFEEAHELIAELDVYTSFADVAYTAPYSYIRPDMKELGTGNVVLKKARHPVLEIQPDMTFIPNDTDLVRGESSFQIITGPNMGGKSTFIRQVGVIVLMAQIGSFVPCDSAEISICDAILARVGAGDSQLRGVSTFMAEMLETSTILHTATPNSLIIIDELGRGTSTYDGFGLAWAISEFISTKVNALCLFATHFHELTQLEEEVPHVKNYHVEAQADDEKGLILLYEVKPGPTDQSFGIHVAKIANFPKQVIELAEQKATELENFEGQDKMDVETAEQQRKDDQIIEKYLKEFTSAPLDTFTATQVKDFMKNLKTKIDKEMTPTLKALLRNN